eukprot:UC4_evm1s268
MNFMNEKSTTPMYTNPIYDTSSTENHDRTSSNAVYSAPNMQDNSEVFYASPESQEQYASSQVISGDEGMYALPEKNQENENVDSEFITYGVQENKEGGYLEVSEQSAYDIINVEQNGNVDDEEIPTYTDMNGV